MAAKPRVFKVAETATAVAWQYADTGATAARIAFDDVPESVKPFLLAYGIRQYIADGSAKDEGTSVADRVNGLQSRIDAIVNGTAGVTTIDPTTFVAAVRAGLITDNTGNREKWNKLSPAQREAIRADSRVVPFLPKPRATEPVANILAAF